MNRPIRFLKNLTALSLGLVLLFGTLSPSAFAQEGGEGWVEPVNLSQSGAASMPKMVVDSTGNLQVFWKDEFAGFMHVSGDGLQWSEPQPTSPPFEDYDPMLVADPVGSIHALWLAPERNAVPLYASQIGVETLTSGGAWTRASMLSDSAVVMDMVADPTGNLHVTYIRSLEEPDSPSGVYYVRWTREGGWGASTLLYSSPYFRTLSIGNGRVDIASTSVNGVPRVYVAWDNPQRERVFLAVSLDGGETWNEPQEIDTPLDTSLTAGPSTITVGADGESVLVVWQTGSRNAACSQFYQWSDDGGSTWSERGRMLEDVPGCPESNQILTGGSDVLLLSSIRQQMYLVAWDGSEWSSAQLQPTLTGFIDPDTFNMVDFNCRQGVLTEQDILYVVGCEEGEGSDIWLTFRSLDNLDTWFSEDPIWQATVSVTGQVSAVFSPVLVADSDNRIHAIWSQSEPGSPLEKGSTLYYSRVEEGQWVSPLVLWSNVSGIATDPDAEIGLDGQLVVVWSGGQSGEITFSQANAARAVIPNSWSDPIVLPSPSPGGSSPKIRIANNGDLYVMYAIPVNEGRGVYVTWSEDGGETWSPAVNAFDAAAAGWEMIDEPKLAITENGHLHAVWTRYTLPSGAGPVGLYYSRSDDGGSTWSPPEAVVEKPVLWDELEGVGQSIVHRVWQELSSGRTALWHELSLDSGVTWSRISPVSIFGETIGEPALAKDAAGRLHLLLTVQRSNAYSMQHWIWNGDSWESEQSNDLTTNFSSAPQRMVVAVASDGSLGVGFRANTLDPFSGFSGDHLFFTSRMVGMPEGVPVAGALEATVSPNVEPTEDTARIPTETPALPIPTETIADDPGGSLLPAWASTALGPVVAILIVMGVLVVSLRGRRNG